MVEQCSTQPINPLGQRGSWCKYGGFCIFSVSTLWIQRKRLDPKRCYMTIEALTGMLRRQYQWFYPLSSKEMSMDNQMVQFQGVSKNTVFKENKQISKWFKIYAICNSLGFLWYWPSDSDRHSIAELASSPKYPLDTAAMCVQLVETLPEPLTQYELDADNYFSIRNLVWQLRSMGICYFRMIGKHRLLSRLRNNWLPSLQQGEPNIHALEDNEEDIEENEKQLRTVLCRWQDENLVHFACSSDYDVDSKIATTNCIDHRMKQPVVLPKIAENFNLYPEDVNKAVNFRSYFITPCKKRRSWVPLFTWLLDSSFFIAWVLLCHGNT